LILRRHRRTINAEVMDMRLLGYLVASVLELGSPSALDSFEFLMFTPPAGWLVVNADGGRQYIRNEPNAVGIINILPSRPAASPAAQIYADIWRVEATKIITGPAPQPAVRTEGEVTWVVGLRQVLSQGSTVRVVVTVAVVRGRALGVVGVSNGEDRHRDVQSFFNTVRAEPNAVATTTAAAPSGVPAKTPVNTPATAPATTRAASANAGGLGYDVPPGYVQERNGETIILSPSPVSERTPCVYGIAPTRPATNNLETDAEAALLQAVVPGFRKLDDRHSAMRGVSAAGWPYVWYRAAFEGDIGGQRQAVNAMAMVLPAGPGRVHVVWGLGNIARCLLDDASFEQFFHSLRPSGWTSDGGQALMRALVGTWRYTASSGLQQFTFRADGTYDRDLGSRAQVGAMERSSSTATGGRFTVRDGEVVLAPDHRPQNPDRYRIRSYDEWFLGGWKKAIALLSAGNPPLVIPYYRVDENAR
jgi:hypothetical protein